MIAGRLPMGERPGVTPVNEALWQKIRDRLNNGPEGPGRRLHFGKL
ncbi:hypothetical protein [Ponticoccus alexandrii]|nr:hypothetical protein [Ponticoccus alexandrii]